MKPRLSKPNRLPKSSTSISASLFLIIISLPTITFASSYYLCQSSTSKRYSEQPCFPNERSTKSENAISSNEVERKRQLEQTKREKVLTQRWQTERQKEEAKLEKQTSLAMREQKQKNTRCEQAMLRTKLAKADLQDAPPKREMQMRKRLDQQQQRADLICKSK